MDGKMQGRWLEKIAIKAAKLLVVEPSGGGPCSGGVRAGTVACLGGHNGYVRALVDGRDGRCGACASLRGLLQRATKTNS